MSLNRLVAKLRYFFVEDIPEAVLREFSPKDASILKDALKTVGQSAPSNLAYRLKRYKPSPEDEVVTIDTSLQLRDLYLTDFEMARLKELKEAKLLRLYLKLEKHLPPELCFMAAQSLRFIVLKPAQNLG
jgi:hypothetical protein